MRLILSLALLISLSCCAQKIKPEPVKGTWVTNVASDALLSKETVAATVKRCKEYGLNSIYVVVWNKGMTMYPSTVVQKYIGVKQDPVYNGFDPIREIVAAGHKAGLKVYAWFEFGFSYNYGDSSSAWMLRYPEWAGRDNKGNLLQKNKFFWWNSLHPDVQHFMSELILEVVTRYNVDGIQGDDRLPAMPSEGGYDPYTKKLYASEHNGALPPANTKDSAWLDWRAKKLNHYIKGLYTDVKKQKPNCIVSWAPSIYPWSNEQYLQDWPSWLNGGYADQILPQLYRYDLKGYEKILKELDQLITPQQKQKVFPGVLMALGDGYLAKPELLKQMIQLDRKYGFMGECTFYYEGLKKLKPYYPESQ